GTKAAARYRLDVPAGGEVVVRLRLTVEPSLAAGGAAAVATLGGLPPAGSGSAPGSGSPLAGSAAVEREPETGSPGASVGTDPGAVSSAAWRAGAGLETSPSPDNSAARASGLGPEFERI